MKYAMNVTRSCYAAYEYIFISILAFYIYIYIYMLD